MVTRPSVLFCLQQWSLSFTFQFLHLTEWIVCSSAQANRTLASRSVGLPKGEEEVDKRQKEANLNPSVRDSSTYSRLLSFGHCRVLIESMTNDGHFLTQKLPQQCRILPQHVARLRDLPWTDCRGYKLYGASTTKLSLINPTQHTFPLTNRS